MAVRVFTTSPVDAFKRDNLPQAGQSSDLPQEGFAYREHLNAGGERADAMVTKGFGDHIALIGNGWRRTMGCSSHRPPTG